MVRVIDCHICTARVFLFIAVPSVDHCAGILH
jgi:hypothetical protein